MFKLFKIGIITAPRALVTLFFIILLSATGVGVITQLVANIEVLVARETRPLLGADIAVEARAGFTGSLREAVAPYIAGISWLKIGEKTTLNTTLFDATGKSILVKLVVVDDSYPMYSEFTTTALGASGTGSTSEMSGGIIAATPNLINRLGRNIVLDGQSLIVRDRIDATSELGFGFGDEGYLLIISRPLLSKTQLLDRGARLDRSILINTPSDAETLDLAGKLEALKASSNWLLSVDSYIENATRTNEVVGELGRYSLVVVLVCILLGSITLYAGLRKYFTQIEKTLEVLYLLGLTRTRQLLLLGSIFVCIIFLSLIASGGAVYGIITLLATYPPAAGFVLLIAPLGLAFLLVGIVILTLLTPEFLGLLGYKNRWLAPLVGFVGAFGVLAIVLQSPLNAGIALLVWWVGVFMLLWIFWLLYRSIFSLSARSKLRERFFGIFDGIRSLARPGMPAASITLTLTLGLAVVLLFLTLTLSFRSRLEISDANTTNLFAINILETDRAKIVQEFWEDKLYAIIQGRITRINGQDLQAHVWGSTGSGAMGGSREFTREFSITTNPLIDTPLSKGSRAKKGEVTVLWDFAERLKVGVGDSIEFSIAGRSFTLRVSGIREGGRTRIEPFFYFQVLPEAFDGAPKTYFLGLNTPDVEWAKRTISALSGPHVVYIDTAAILTQVKTISSKILSVLSLFLGFVWVFAVLAILTLFGRMWPLFERKKYLYRLLGMSGASIRTTQVLPVVGVLGISTVLALALGFGWVEYVFSLSSLLSWQMQPVLTSLGISLALLVGLMVYLRFTLLKK
jgi:putative ABC transport system permease protein